MFGQSYAPNYGRKPNPKTAPCECGKRVSREDITAMMCGEVLKCSYCNELIWFDESTWIHPGDMSFHYIRWGKDPKNIVKLSFWFLGQFLAGVPAGTGLEDPLPFQEVE